MVFSCWTSTVTYTFYYIILVYKLSPLNQRYFFKKIVEGKKKRKSVQEARTSMMQIMILKAKTRGTFWVDVVLKLRNFSTNNTPNNSLRTRLSTYQVLL